MKFYKYASAVRPGDVSVVPVPAAVWLFGSRAAGIDRHRAAAHRK